MTSHTLLQFLSFRCQLTASMAQSQSESQQQGDAISSEDWARTSSDPTQGPKAHESHGLDTGVRVMGTITEI